MQIRSTRNSRNFLSIPVCRYKCYFHPRHHSLSDVRRDARKMFREVRACKQGLDLFRISVPYWILLNPTTIRLLLPSSLLLVDFVPRLFSRTGESLCRRVRVSRHERRGESFTSPGKRKEKTNCGLERRRPQDGGGKIGRSSENFSVLLRVSRSYISSEKNNGYFLAVTFSLRQNENSALQDFKKRERGRFWFAFRDNTRAINNCNWIQAF